MPPKRPSYRDQITAAIRGVKKGRSREDLKRFYNYLPPQYRYLNAALKAGVDDGTFVMNPKHPGHYQLNPHKKSKACQDPTKVRDPAGSRCRPGYRTPCKSPDYRRRRSSRTTTNGGRIYECVRRKSRRKKSKKQAKRTVKKQSKKGAQVRPRKPWGAYRFFVKENAKNMPPDNSRDDKLQLLGAQWRALDDRGRLKYIRMAEKDKQRFIVEFDEYIVQFVPP